MKSKLIALHFLYLIMSILKKIFCKHDYHFYRNIYGDEIIYCGYKRSIWKCSKCGKKKYKDELLKED